MNPANSTTAATSAGVILPLTIKVNEICSLLDICQRSLWRYVARGWLPKPFKSGRDALWNRSAVMDAVEELMS